MTPADVSEELKEVAFAFFQGQREGDGIKPSDFQAGVQAIAAKTRELRGE